MGTRHLIKVKYKGEVKVAQYGQWDGYPDGQGLDILKFLRNKIKVEELKEKLSKVRFLDKEGRDKEFIDSYNKNAPEWSSEPDKRTEEQKQWFRSFATRDLGAEILDSIINSEDEEILLEEDNGELCEGFFTIDLDKMTYKVKFYSQKETFNINDLPDEEDFKLKFKDEEDE
jgi:hypothetical protein